MADERKFKARLAFHHELLKTVFTHLFMECLGLEEQIPTLPDQEKPRYNLRLTNIHHDLVQLITDFSPRGAYANVICGISLYRTILLDTTIPRRFGPLEMDLVNIQAGITLFHNRCKTLKKSGDFADWTRIRNTCTDILDYTKKIYDRLPDEERTISADAQENVDEGEESDASDVTVCDHGQLLSSHLREITGVLSQVDDYCKCIEASSWSNAPGVEEQFRNLEWRLDTIFEIQRDQV